MIKNDKIILYPKDATIYQGLRSISSKDDWFTNNISYTCSYAGGKDGVVRVCNTKDYLNLVNIEKLKSSDFSNKKDIKISNNSGKIYISMKELFQIIFGMGHKKTPQIKNLKDIETLKNVDNKFKNTQYGKFYKLACLLGKEDKTIEWMKYIITGDDKYLPWIKDSFKPTRKYITKTNAFNRISDWNLDLIFFKNLKKTFPKEDGFYGVKLSSDWNIQTDDVSGDVGYYMPPEIALWKKNKINKTNILSNKICKYFTKFSSKKSSKKNSTTSKKK
jgi:hypothetical protein